MSDCTDREMKERLAAYEMGLLKGKELEQVERHLLTCDDCLEEARQFHNVASHILNSPKIRRLVHEPERATKKTISPRRKTIWAFIPVAVIALLVLIMQPWKIDIKSQRAVAEENRLMILCFRDLSEGKMSAGIGDIVRNLLMTDLAESYYVQIAPDHQLQGLLRSTGIDDVCDLDNVTTVHLASQAKARWILQGAIIHEGGRIGLTAEVIDAESGSTVATQQVIGEKEDDIFTLVDRLTVEIKKDIALPEAALQEIDRMVSEITTNSPDAYRQFLEGVRYYNMLYYDSSMEAFKKAIVFDSTFAMAYYYLANMKDTSYSGLAVKFSDKASWREKRYIKSQQASLAGNLARATDELNQIIDRYPYETEAYLQLSFIYIKKNDYDKVIECLEAALEVDPYYKLAYNNLAFAFENRGENEKAIVAINKYVELAPEEANPYDSRGLIYANIGKLDEAIASFETALEKNPDFSESSRLLGALYPFKREYVKADSLYNHIIASRDSKQQVWAIFNRSMMLIRQGRLDSALIVLDKLVSYGEIKEISKTLMADVIFLRASIYRAKDQIGTAALEMDNIFKNHDLDNNHYPYGFKHVYVQILAEKGDLNKADSVLGEIRAAYDTVPKLGYCYWYARGGLAFAQKNYGAAETAFDSACVLRSSFTEPGYYEARYMLAQTYLRQQKAEEAVELYEELSLRYNYRRAFWSLWDVQSHYYLGIAYENSGWFKKAAVEYQTFLDYWQNGDSGLSHVDDARQRLKQIENAS